MKKYIVILSCFLCSSCFYFITEEEPEEFISYYDPVILSRSELENSIAIENEKNIVESSKVYIFEDYIFINDKREGFHVFDNSDPENPVKKWFLKAPGATDIAIRNDVIFINQATDLVVLTLDLNDFTLTLNKRLRSVFPELISPEGMHHFTEENMVVVNWIKKQ